MLPFHRFLCISIHFPTFTSTSRQKNPGVLGLGTSHSAFAPRGVGNEVKGAALNPKAGVVTWSRAGFAMLDCVEIRDTPSSRRFAIVAANDCLNADAYAGRIAAEIVLASVAGILDAFQNVIVALSEKAAPRSRTLVFVHERSLARCTCRSPATNSLKVPRGKCGCPSSWCAFAADRSVQTLAESVRGAADRINPARVPGPRDRPRRAALATNPDRLFRYHGIAVAR